MLNPFDCDAIYATHDVQSRVRDYLQWKDTTPIHADLDITTACNYQCPHCGDLARKQLNRGGMNQETLSSVIEDFQSLNVKDVSLIGGGEPLASPHFEMVIRELARRRIRVGVVTNGSLISPTIAASIHQYCAWVRVSLDAATSETYTATHKPNVRNAYSVVLDNIAQLTSAMPGKIGVSFLVMNRNVSEIAAATLLARDLGCAYIRLRIGQHPTTGVFIRIQDRAELAKQVNASIELRTESFAVSIGDSLDGYRCNDSIIAQLKNYSRCHVQAFGLTITGTGAVHICSRWRGDQSTEIGNVVHERLSNIWFGNRRKDVVEGLNPGHKCSDAYCQAHRYNELIDAMMATS